jgi:hypothetical protein
MRCIDGVLPPVHVEDFLGVTIAPESHSESYKRSLYRHWIDEVGDKLGTRQQARPRNTGEFRISAVKRKNWRPQRESNPCLHCERVVS